VTTWKVPEFFIEKTRSKSLLLPITSHSTPAFQSATALKVFVFIIIEKNKLQATTIPDNTPQYPAYQSVTAWKVSEFCLLKNKLQVSSLAHCQPQYTCLSIGDGVEGIGVCFIKKTSCKSLQYPTIPGLSIGDGVEGIRVFVFLEKQAPSLLSCPLPTTIPWPIHRR
jgi:hypothetical protein